MGQFSVEKPVLPGSVLSGNQHKALRAEPNGCAHGLRSTFADKVARQRLVYKLARFI
jgi:hypothetical protein